MIPLPVEGVSDDWCVLGVGSLREGSPGKVGMLGNGLPGEMGTLGNGLPGELGIL